MSPQRQTQPSRSQNKDEVRSRGSKDLPRTVTQEEFDALSEDERIFFRRDTSTSLPASADPSNPLSGAPAMGAALAEIERAVPGPSTRPNKAGPSRRPDPAGYLREQIAAKAEAEAARKAEADKAAALDRAGRHKRPRNISGDLTTEAGKKPKVNPRMADPTAMDIDMRAANPSRDRPKSFDDMWRPFTARCAVRIGGPENEIMGNPFEQTPGWSVKVALDSGKSGLPSVGLDFRFAKNGIDSKHSKHYNSFAVGWEPGVMIGDQWMMEGLDVQPARVPTPPIPDHVTFPEGLRKFCKTDVNANKLICMIFKSNVHKTSEMSTEWARALPGNSDPVFNNLERMYGAKDPSYLVTIWFMGPTINLPKIWKGCMDPLKRAVKDHTPPYHQYLDEDDQPMISFNLPTIDVIGNGMYKSYPIITEAGKKTKSTKPHYMTLPRTVTWDSIKSFHVTFGVPIVREVQFNLGQYVRLERDWHGCFIQKMPNMEFDGRILEANPIMRGAFRVGVRMPRDKNGQTDPVPIERSIVTFEFNNRSRTKEHKYIKEDICLGRVENLGGQEWLDKTGCDFCVVMSQPPHSRLRLRAFDSPRSLPNEKLWKAKLRVKISTTAAEREMDALDRFCDVKFASELLDPIRLAFWSDPSRAPEMTDLTMGPAHNRSMANKEKYNQILEEMKKKRSTTQSQDEVLQAPAHLRSKMAVIQGPAGAGKTLTIRDMVIALASIGHKVGVVASSNVAVDNLGEAIWVGMDDEQRKTLKCLRLETDGAERAQRLIKANYAHYTGSKEEADNRPNYLGPKEAQANPAISSALDSLCNAFAQRSAYATKMMKRYEDVNASYKAVQDFEGYKLSNVPSGITLDYRMWEIREEDKLRAPADYDVAKNRLTPEEWTRQIANGEINIDKFDKSRKYEECVNHYRTQEGQVTKAERTALEDESDKMHDRVLEETSILLTTASNCGGDLLESSHSFVPTVIICEETGQISIASLCVPLTIFEKWEGLLMFGDIKQLQPTALSGVYNEFIANAKTSPLALLAVKNFRTIILEDQFRMGPALSKFPREQFYDGKSLKDTLTSSRDNLVRKTIRKITKDMGVAGDNGDGSEYVVVDVKNGCSRVEAGGTSLVNYANADTIIKIIDTLLKVSVGLTIPIITASMIQVLVYYQGQRRLIRKKIYEMPWTPEQKAAIDLNTVDSFQGKERPIVIFDMIAAKDNIVQRTRSEEDAPEDEKDVGREDYIMMGTLTAHVRQPNRLNVGLTRGKDAMFVICQATLLVAGTKKQRGKQYNAPANMIGDAWERKCILESSTEDSHPDSVKLRQEKGEQFVREQRDKRRRDTLDFIAQGMQTWSMMRKGKALPQGEDVKHYRTREGHSTRPIGNPKLAARADAYDAYHAEQARIRAAAAASLASARADEENDRRLRQGVEQSLAPDDFPPLPDARQPDLSIQARATAEDEPKDDTASDSDDRYASTEEDDFDDEEEDETLGEVGEEYRNMPAGDKYSQFG